MAGFKSSFIDRAESGVFFVFTLTIICQFMERLRNNF